MANSRPHLPGSRSFATRAREEVPNPKLVYEPSMLFEQGTPIKHRSQSSRQGTDRSSRSVVSTEFERSNVLEKRLALQRGKHLRLQEEHQELQLRLSQTNHFYQQKIHTLKEQLAVLQQNSGPNSKMQLLVSELQEIRVRVGIAAEVASELALI